MLSVARIVCFLCSGWLLSAQCKLPEAAPDAIARLTPDELLDNGHFVRAAQLLQPTDARNAYLLSRAKAALGDLDEALKLAESALAADDANPAYHVQVAAVAGQLAEKATLFKQLSLARRAKKELDTAAELAPDSAQAQWGLMMYYFAVPTLIGGDKTKARQIGDQLAAAQPEPGLYYRARLAIEMNESAQAEQFLQQALLANPLSFDSAAALATFYIERKPDQAKAERWACLAVHTNPTRADAYALLAKAHAMCGCWTEAVAIAEYSQTIDPDDLSPWYSIAQVALARHEQLAPAAEWLRKYLASAPNGTPESTTIPAQAALKQLAP